MVLSFVSDTLHLLSEHHHDSNRGRRKSEATGGPLLLFWAHALDRTGSLNPIEKAVRRIDGFQQRQTAISFVFGVVKKFGDDAAGTLVALITYYGVLSLFPLLLVLTTVLGLFFAHNA